MIGNDSQAWLTETFMADFATDICNLPLESKDKISGNGVGYSYGLSRKEP